MVTKILYTPGSHISSYVSSHMTHTENIHGKYIFLIDNTVCVLNIQQITGKCLLCSTAWKELVGLVVNTKYAYLSAQYCFQIPACSRL